jgi:HK97 family phage prohead protease
MTTALKPERRNGTKTALRPFEIKASNADERTFEGLAAAYSLDLGGDVIMPGAFTKTLAYWREKGFSIPLLNQHNYYNGIHDVLGSMVDAEERTEGLWAKFEVSQGANGDLLLDHIKNKRLNGLSIGYQPVEYEINTDTGVRTLTEIRLREVSAVIWPMNEDAVIDASSVKSAASEMSDDELKESLAALEREAKARAEKANPKLSQEKADELRDRLRSSRLRSLLSRTSGQNSAQLTPTKESNDGNPQGTEDRACGASH